MLLPFPPQAGGPWARRTGTWLWSWAWVISLSYRKEVVVKIHFNELRHFCSLWSILWAIISVYFSLIFRSDRDSDTWRKDEL